MVLPAFATRMRRTLVAAGVAAMAPWTLAATPLADQPVFTNSQVPGNLALALSVEYPTAVSVAHIAGYASSNTYLGYFDPNKCYLYHFSVVESDRHFYPAGAATGRECTGTDNSKWSGNFLNWATMQTADPFRWALTGGYRARDTTTETAGPERRRFALVHAITPGVARILCLRVSHRPVRKRVRQQCKRLRSQCQFVITQNLGYPRSNSSISA
jgi:hypothetical protein